MKRLCFRLHGVLLLGIAVMLNCAIGTSTLTVLYKSDLPENTTLKNLPPIKLVVNRFEDDRARIDRVANKKNTYGCVMGKAVTSTDVRDIIQDAIINEFEKNGHHCYRSGEPTDANLVIDGILTEFQVEQTPKLFTVETVAAIRANVIVKEAKTNNVVFLKSLTGYHSTDKAVAWTGTWADNLNIALSKFVSELTTNTEFLKACQSVQ